MTDNELRKVANEIRKGVVTSTHAAKSGHPGGSLSAADIFAYLYFEEMNVDPADPRIIPACAGSTVIYQQAYQILRGLTFTIHERTER